LIAVLCDAVFARLERKAQSLIIDMVNKNCCKLYTFYSSPRCWISFYN